MAALANPTAKKTVLRKPAAPRPTRSMAVALRELPGDWKILCEGIGERRAGTTGERRAAEFIVQRLRDAGIPRVRTELFPCTSLHSARAEVQALTGKAWRKVEAAVVVGAPSTPGQVPVEGPLVWLEMPEAGHRLRPGGMRGQILGLFGPMPTSAAMHRRLVAAEPLAVIHIDERFPLSWTKNDGVYPYWARRYGMPPTLTVPYTEAWRWRCDGVARLRVRAVADLRRAESQNVVGELPGLEPRLPGLIITAHHDTQCGNPGADDNGSGVVSLLTLARALAGHSWRRTIQFASFGAEEQLSVGSTAFVRRHKTGTERTGLVLNFDSVASPLGHFSLWLAGDPRLARFATRRLAQGGLDAEVRHVITPFVDCFPFNRAGIPSIWFRRTNFVGGRWQHHSRHDTLANVSVTELSRLLTAIGPLVHDLANRKTWPFEGRLNRTQRAGAVRISRELLGW
ncbi:MAG: Zn-dependent exopeptidase M28 [Opitutus sp.]|nr:Zn-dependent exopeptidase M28 [Opitutus sp.]